MDKYIISPQKISKLAKIGSGGYGVVYSGTYAQDSGGPPLSVRCCQRHRKVTSLLALMCDTHLQRPHRILEHFVVAHLVPPSRSFHRQHLFVGTIQRRSQSSLTIRLCLQVALKMLETNAGVTKESLSPFNREVQLLEMASSRCEHVCRFYGISSCDGQPCIVMKLYSKSLAAELQSTIGNEHNCI